MRKIPQFSLTAPELATEAKTYPLGLDRPPTVSVKRDQAMAVVVQDGSCSNPEGMGGRLRDMQLHVGCEDVTHKRRDDRNHDHC